MITGELERSKLTKGHFYFAVVAVILAIIIASFQWNRVPTDEELINRFNKHQNIFEKYVHLLSETKKLNSIRVSLDASGGRVFTNLASGLDLDEKAVVSDFTKKLKIDLISLRSYVQQSEDIPNEIAFFSYRKGFAKGIAYIVEIDALHLVDDLSAFGTKHDPRRASGQTSTTYRKIKNNWYLFAQ